MKRFFLLLTTFAFILLSAMADLPFRNHRYDGFKPLKITPQSIVFVGNSITNMHEWWESFGNPNVVNRGNSGAVSDEMLDNLEAILAGRPAKIFLLIGTNDLGTSGINSPERIARNLRHFVKRCKKESPSTAVYIQSILPSTVGLRNLVIEQQTNQLIQQICTEQGVHYVDLWEDLKGIPTNSNLSLDQLHLTGASYRIWCKKIATLVGSNCTYPDDAANQFGTYSTSNHRSEAMRTSAFGMTQVKAEDILYIGDEMVHGGEWHELLNSSRVKNRGIGWGYSGPRIEQVKGSLATILTGRTGNVAPAQIHFYVGTTDANQKETTIESLVTQYRSLIEEAKRLAPTTKIFAHSLLPKNNANENTTRIAAFNTQLQEALNGMANVTYVDLYTPMVKNGVGNTEYFQGNYVSGKGYVKIAHIMAQAINEPSIQAIGESDATAQMATFEARTALAQQIRRIETLPIGTEMGHYRQEDVQALNADIEAAYTLLAATNTDNATFTQKANELKSKADALMSQLIKPQMSTATQEYWYNLYTPNRENRYMTSQGANAALKGLPNELNARNQWKFVQRTDDNTKVDIINRADKSYLNPQAGYDAAVSTTTNVPTKGWELDYAAQQGLFIIHAGTVQLNQTNNSHAYAVFNWSANQTGLDRNDAGCQYAIVEAPELPAGDPSMPFLTTTIDPNTHTFAPHTRWYTLQIGSAGLYISNPQDAASIDLKNTKTTLSDDDLWCFVGNATTGYKIYNKATGTAKVLAAPAQMSGTTGGTAYLRLMAEDALNGYRPYWRFTPSTNLGENKPSYYMNVDGAPTERVNNRNNKLAFWTGGADAGSSIQVLFAKQTFTLDMTTGALSGGPGSFHKLWTSTATAPKVTLSSGSYNNMTQKGGQIAAYVGMYSPCAYTIGTDKGYTISDYSFEFVNDNYNGSIKLTAGDKTMNSSTQKQTLTQNNLDKPAQFTLTGENKGILLSNFQVTVARSIAPVEPQTEIFSTETTAAIPYRIPAIATASNGDLIAVADYRHARQDIGMATNGRLDLHARISKDHGATWQPVFSLRNGMGGNNGFNTAFGDPCIVADRESNKVLVLSCAGNVSFPNGTPDNHQGIAHFLSEDNGATWSEPTDLESQFYTPLKTCSRGPVNAMFIGSGKIHQSRYTKVGEYYRLYLSTLVKDKNKTHCNYVYYSDDFGSHWQLLGDAETPAIPSGADEPKVEELPDGSVICSSRISGGRYFNIFTFTNTQEGKGTWSGAAQSGQSNQGTTAVSNSTNGEILILPVRRKADNKAMYVALQSVPLGPNRSNVGIYYKKLENLNDYVDPATFAANWDGHRQVSTMGSAYSTMTLQKDNHIGFIYEEDTYGANSGGGYTIVYKKFSVEQLTDSLYTLDLAIDKNRDAMLQESAQIRVQQTTATAPVLGMIDPAKMPDVQQALTTCTTTPNAQNYQQLNAAIQSSLLRAEAGKTYTFTNRLYKTHLTPKADATLTGSNERGWSQQFVLQGKEDGTFLLYHPERKQWLAPTQAQYASNKMVSSESQAGIFRCVDMGNGYTALSCTNPTNASLTAIHLSQSNALVSWYEASEASLWQISPITEITLPLLYQKSANEIATTDGLTGKGLSNDNTNLVFDAAGDALQVHLAAPAPNTYLWLDATAEGFAGTFDITTSADGVHYSAAPSLPALNSATQRIAIPLSETTRYVRLQYANGSGKVKVGSLHVDAATMVTVDDKGYTTFTSDNAYYMPTDWTAYSVETTTNANLQLTDVTKERTVVAAQTPLLIQAPASTYAIESAFTEANLSNPSQNQLRVATQSQTYTAPEGTRYYIFTEDPQHGLGFYWQEATQGKSADLSKGECYLEVALNGAEPIQGYPLEKNIETGIRQRLTKEEAQPLYNLSGRRVQPNYRGIVIRKGLKFQN